MRLNLLAYTFCEVQTQSDEYTVAHYLNIMRESGWGSFRKYLESSLTQRWDALAVRNPGQRLGEVILQYHIMKELLKMRRFVLSSGGLPLQLWAVLKHDFDVAVSSHRMPIVLSILKHHLSQASRSSEDRFKDLGLYTYPFLTQILHDRKLLDGETFPALQVRYHQS